MVGRVVVTKAGLAVDAGFFLVVGGSLVVASGGLVIATKGLTVTPRLEAPAIGNGRFVVEFPRTLVGANESSVLDFYYDYSNSSKYFT